MSFQFRQFNVEDGRCAMKVSTDGVLLGTWAKAAGDALNILDIGAGCGVVSLILAQRYSRARITAIELDPDAATDCAENFAASPWHDRLQAVCADAMEYTPEESFDLIVSNPPFFTEALKAPDARRATARHAAALSPFSVIDFAAKFLSADGRMAMITDCRNTSDIILHARINRLNVLEMTGVSTKQGKPDKRMLWLFAAEDAPLRKSQLPLRNPDGSWHHDYVRLVEPFYLRMPKT